MPFLVELWRAYYVPVLYSYRCNTVGSIHLLAVSNICCGPGSSSSSANKAKLLLHKSSDQKILLSCMHFRLSLALNTVLYACSRLEHGLEDILGIYHVAKYALSPLVRLLDYEIRSKFGKVCARGRQKEWTEQIALTPNRQYRSCRLKVPPKQVSLFRIASFGRTVPPPQPVAQARRKQEAKQRMLLGSGWEWCIAAFST